MTKTENDPLLKQLSALAPEKYWYKEELAVPFFEVKCTDEAEKYRLECGWLALKLGKVDGLWRIEDREYSTEYINLTSFEQMLMVLERKLILDEQGYRYIADPIHHPKWEEYSPRLSPLYDLEKKLADLEAKIDYVHHEL